MSDWTIKPRRGHGQPNPGDFDAFEIALDLAENQLWFRSGDEDDPVMEPVKIASNNIYDKGAIGGVAALQDDTRIIKNDHMPVTTSDQAPTQNDADAVKSGHIWLQYES